jgi:hypothetical protein
VKGCIHCVRGELGWVQVDFFLFFFTVEGEGGGS